MSIRTLKKMRYKAKHGLLIQEILNSFGRRGMWVSPYITYCETDEPVEYNSRELQDIEFRELQLDDAGMIAAMEENAIPEDKIEKRFADGGIAFGAFYRGRLVAIIWANLNYISGLGDSPPIRKLESDEAYLYGTFTLREYRGRGIIPALRAPFRRRLGEIGRHKCYSVNMYFNRAARRMKEKFGARQLELRLSIALFGRIRKDFLLKILSR